MRPTFSDVLLAWHYCPVMGKLAHRLFGTSTFVVLAMGKRLTKLQIMCHLEGLPHHIQVTWRSGRGPGDEKTRPCNPLVPALPYSACLHCLRFRWGLLNLSLLCYYPPHRACYCRHATLFPSQCRWLTFHSGYDFGYLLKLLTCQVSAPSSPEIYPATCREKFPADIC